MRRIMLSVSYDGTDYAGWQRQENAPSVQQHIEENLETVCKEKITLYGSGRTDAGVHALGQVAHFDTSARMPADKFTFALNAGLPRDIRILESREAPEGFHARYSAKSKRYRYTIRNAPVASALTGRYEWHLHAPLRKELMVEAAGFLVGVHDYSAFTGAGCKITDRVRTLTRSEIMVDGELLHYEVDGSGFLYNMVRIIVGTLVDIGYHRIPAEDIAHMLSSKERSAAGQTAPAQGLMLMQVDYGKGPAVIFPKAERE